MDELRHSAVSAGKSVSRGTATLLVFIALMVGFIVGTRSGDFEAQVVAFLSGKKIDTSLDLSSVEKTYQALAANYDGTLDTAALIDGASRGLVAAAGDRYTVFMDKKEAEAFQKELSGEISGIGAEIGVRGGQPTILRVLSNSPAEKAGVKSGDVILAVNDIAMRDADAETAAKAIRGDEGTSVKLILKRAEEQKDFTIVRGKVTDTSVRAEVRNGIGIMTITRFDADTGQKARQAAESFKSQSVRGVILDLRDNGGGYLDAGRDVAGLWVKDKPLVSEKTGGKVTDTISSTAEPILAGMPTKVLINGSSASASEIVAGALQDYSVAALIGEKTFGKGTVQKMIDLADGRQLKVTIARWYTPKGKNITKEGISPDTTVEMSTADVNDGRDPQLDAALKALVQ